MWVVIGLVVLSIGGSLFSFFHYQPYRNSYFSFELFYTLLFVYISVMLGFASIYFILSFNGIILIEGNAFKSVNVLESLAHSLYFSGVTLLTVGYGDITPIGIGRLLALIEALIGYILPAAFFLKLWQSSIPHQSPENEQEKFNHL
ncbi:potassium channel family protein [Aquibacillus sp. 3ASR75-11]|uniref:Potassium channel family protein n=2 Tax=Terrihalobacillus insolitus TaxID=2950438 RepID=A0A9X4AMC6_9BACI|nr:potassium channel family protein [Terrihalobacillus insolitus]MDC3425287.1 potassium channel family protein [Terrihalobacillus insolitus]